MRRDSPGSGVSRSRDSHWSEFAREAIATPHTRTLIPRHPAKVDELPNDLQEWIKPITRLHRTKFLEDKRVQPIEQVKCRTWRNNPHWIEADQDRITVFQNGGASWFAVDRNRAIAIFWPTRSKN